LPSRSEIPNIKMYHRIIDAYEQNLAAVPENTGSVASRDS
jgi:hypothetical protein